jgi:hypothetical protein
MTAMSQLRDRPAGRTTQTTGTSGPDPADAGTFAADLVAPRVARPERVLPADELAELLTRAADSGLLPGTSKEPGLWGSPGSTPDEGPAALRAVAKVNGGVAFALHRAALSGRLRERLGLAHGARSALSLHGHYGLGRGALPRLLAGRELSAEETVLLADWLDLGTHSRVVITAPWQTLLTVAFDGGQVGWLDVARSDCEVQARPHSHGLDELETSTVRCPTAVATGPGDTDAYVEALYLDGLGMLAIAAGVVEHGLELARDYARERRQGGAMIDAYPAVQQMLAQISATARAGAQHLSWFASREPSLEALAELCAIRSAFHPACCVAANNSIQILGGRGYMQDFGPEKLVRDANTLRVLGGTPTELQLFVAEWERMS